jgi:hypothetical protein
MLLLLHQKRATGGSDRRYTSTTVKQALIVGRGQPSAAHTQLSHPFGFGGLKVAEFRDSAKGLPVCGAKLG